MSTQGIGVSLTAKLFSSAVRVILGVMWLYQGLFKIQAHFGGADILLVVQSTAGNSRVPVFFKDFAHSVLGSFPDLVGLMIPLLEIGLGVALIVGIVTLPAALGSVFTLMNYWFSDQLIWEYPIMVLLSTFVIAFPRYAGTFSVTSLIARMRRRRSSDWLRGPARRWL